MSAYLHIELTFFNYLKGLYALPSWSDGHCVTVEDGYDKQKNDVIISIYLPSIINNGEMKI